MVSIAILNGEKGTLHIIPNCLDAAQGEEMLDEEAREIVGEWCDKNDVSDGNINWQVIDGNIKIEEV